MIVSHRDRNWNRVSATVAAVALLALTGCAVGPVGPNSWNEYLPEDVQHDLEKTANATLIVSTAADGPREVQLEASTTYLLFVERDDYADVAASGCIIDADAAIKVKELPQSELNIPYKSRTFFTFGEFTTDSAIFTAIDCNAPATTILAIPEADIR